MNFRTKTILGIALIELVLLSILVGSTLNILRHSNEGEVERRLHLGARLLAAAAKDALLAEDLATLDSLADEVMVTHQIDFVRIVSVDGRVLTQRGAAELLARPFHPEVRFADAKDNILDAQAEVSAGGISYGSVQMGISTEPLDVLLSTARRWAVGISLVEILFVAMFSWLLGTYLLRELRALQHASQRLGNGDFASRVEVRGRDELAAVAMAFNDMAVQIGVIFELSPDGFVVFDGMRRVKYVNPAFTRLTGLARGDIEGLDESGFSDMLAARCRVAKPFPGVEQLRKRLSVESDAPCMIELQAPVSTVLEIDLRLAQSGGLSQVLYLRDVTHIVALDRMKSEFLASAAHELRTPMVTIHGYSELLNAMEFSPEASREMAGAIHTHSTRMRAIVNELLDLARLEAAGGRDFVLADADALALVRSCLARYPVPLGREVPFLRFVELEPGWHLHVDPERICQAIGQVLANAYAYSAASTPVEVELASSRGASGPVLRLAIADHGIGMSPAEQGRVFERFWRADQSGQTTGTGLGMSLVKEIVEFHGGQVEIRSEQGRGTTVTLVLPLAPKMARLTEIPSTTVEES